MAKLHELLAVEGDLKARAAKTLSQVKDLFQNGTGKLLGQISTHKPINENDETLPPKITTVATTVKEQLALLQKPFAGWVDVAIQKEITNQTTTASVDIGGETVDLPAPALLNLESKLTELRGLYNSIPTNDVTTPWEWDDDNGYFVSDPPEVRRTTKKVLKAFTAYEATDKHPAQVETFTEDILSGHMTITKQSGMITPKDKQGRLERIDQLIMAVKKARQRANDIEIREFNLGDDIFNFINGE